MTVRRLGRVPTAALALVVPLVALVAVVVTLSVTDDSAGTATSRVHPPAGGSAIAIKNFQFSPNPIEVDAGATLSVTNDDGTVHTLTADHGTFDTGELDHGASATISIETPGRYAYHCAIHNYMTGTVEVR